MSSNSDDPSDSFRDAGFFENNEILDVSRLRDMAAGRADQYGKCDCNLSAYVPPQNSMLVLLHFVLSTSFRISSTSYSRVTTLTGSGYASPKTARTPGKL